MKKVIIVFLITVSIANAQKDNLSVNKLFYFNTSLDSTRTENLFKSKNQNSNQAKLTKFHQVEIKSFDSDSIEFAYLKFKETTANAKIYNDKTFKMSKSEFEKLTNVYYGRYRKLIVGAYTIPFRIRSKNENFEFESNLSLGANLIKGINFSKFYDKGHIDLSIGIALTKINLNENNSSINDIDEDLKTLAESALTLSFGTTFNFNDNVNFGVFYGWDFLDGASQEKIRWIHNKKPWIGFGINVNFNTNSNTVAKQTGQIAKK